MSILQTQEERLSFLVEEFKEDSTSYKELETPADTAGRQQILRALMNVRMPRRMRHRGDVAVAVARDWWNCGVGSQFMSALIDFARSHQITVLDLQVRSDNHAAIHLYEKFGFQQIGVHPAFFRIDGRDIPFTMMCCTL